MMTTERFGELTWRHGHASAAAYGRWFERQYGYDLESYLHGYDDAGADCPVGSLRSRAAPDLREAMDAFEPAPLLYEFAIGPMPVPDESADWLPF